MTAARAPDRARAAASAAATVLAASIALGGCGQFGPLRFPEETTAQARSRADSRRLPETRRDAPIPTTDPVGNPSPR